MPQRSHPRIPLAELALFADAGKAELQKASALLTAVTLESGKVLMRQGSIGNEFMIVADGLVDVAREDHDRPEPVLAVVTSGDVLGEMSLLHGVRRSATAITRGPTTVYAATPREFFALMEAVPSVAEHIVEAATARRHANQAA